MGANLAPAFSNLFGGGYHWQWALRVTPALGVICCLLIMIVTKEPPRGMAEHAAPLHRTTVKQDIIALVKKLVYPMHLVRGENNSRVIHHSC